MSLKQKALTGADIYVEETENINYDKNMLYFKESDVLEAVKEVDDFIRMLLTLKTTYNESPRVVLAEVGLELEKVFGEIK